MDSRRLAAVIAACFIVGVGWPIVGGFDLVPRPKSLRAKAGKKPVAMQKRGALPGPKGNASNTALSLSKGAPVLTKSETTRIRQTVVAGCGSDDSKFGNQCDTPHLLAVLEEPLRQLASCKAAEGASGLLSLGLKLDFGRGHISRVKSGKSTTLPTGRADALIACAKTSVVGTPLRGIAHDHRYYWAYYLTDFIPPGSPTSDLEATQGPLIPASGTATVGWDAAQVRENPDHTATLRTELEFGTRVQVTGRQGVWYQVKFGNPTEQGWVHETTLGL